MLCRTHTYPLTDLLQSRFGMLYMHCGCPLPVRTLFEGPAQPCDSPQTTQGTTVGQRLSRLSALVLSPRPHIDPPMDREDCHSATHPSDHNSIFINSPLNKERREMRKLTWQRRRDRDGEKLKGSKGKAKNKDRDLEERHARGQDHDAAFMVPVPLIYGYGYPYVYPLYPGSCAGVSHCSPVHSVYLRAEFDYFRVSPDVSETKVQPLAVQRVA